MNKNLWIITTVCACLLCFFIGFYAGGRNAAIAQKTISQSRTGFNPRQFRQTTALPKIPPRMPNIPANIKNIPRQQANLPKIKQNVQNNSAPKPKADITTKPKNPPKK